MSRPRSTRKAFARAVAPVGILVLSAGVLAQDCFKEIPLGMACDLNGCQGSTDCGAVQIVENESVTTTGTPGPRTGTTPKDFLCWKEWIERDEFGVCNVLADCQSTTSGSLVSGGACSAGPGGPQ